jgi:hypothetical protein
MGIKTFKVECCECGRLVDVPKNLSVDVSQGSAVFCSKECEDAEAKRVYVDENTQDNKQGE